MSIQRHDLSGPKASPCAPASAPIKSSAKDLNNGSHYCMSSSLFHPGLILNADPGIHDRGHSSLQQIHPGSLRLTIVEHRQHREARTEISSSDHERKEEREKRAR